VEQRAAARADASVDQLDDVARPDVDESHLVGQVVGIDEGVIVNDDHLAMCWSILQNRQQCFLERLL
jgi:hypothetical protein